MPADGGPGGRESLHVEPGSVAYPSQVLPSDHNTWTQVTAPGTLGHFLAGHSLAAP